MTKLNQIILTTVVIFVVSGAITWTFFTQQVTCPKNSNTANECTTSGVTRIVGWPAYVKYFSPDDHAFASRTEFVWYWLAVNVAWSGAIGIVIGSMMRSSTKVDV